MHREATNTHKQMEWSENGYKKELEDNQMQVEDQKRVGDQSDGCGGGSVESR